MAFAGNLARAYAARGGDVFDLFAAYAGVTCERDQRMGAACLRALDQWLERDIADPLKEGRLGR